MPAPKAPEAFFNATMRVYKGISFEVALFCIFLHFFLHFFCIFLHCIFFRGQVAFSPPPLAYTFVDVWGINH